MGVRQAGAVIGAAAAWFAVAAVPAQTELVDEEGSREMGPKRSRVARSTTGPVARHAAKGLRPRPGKARKDRGRLHNEGCLVKPRGAKLKRCVYGKKKSSTKVVLLGDSSVLQYGNAFLRLAHKLNWRLVAHAKSGCTPASTPIHSRNLGRKYRECARWRNRALRWIERKDPALVAISSSAGHQAIAGGRRLKGSARVDALEDGYVATLDRLDAAGVQAVVMRDLPNSPERLVKCVARKRKRAGRRCGFPIPGSYERQSFDLRAANRSGAPLVDLSSHICPDGRCRAVIRRVIVYRDPPHITGTFARKLAPRIRRQLPRV